MDKRWVEILKPFVGAKNLNVGCGRSPEISAPGCEWVNLDMATDGPADVIHNVHDLPLPFPDNEFDTVLTVHVLEHVDKDKLIDLVYDFSRILKVGGYMIAIVPHGSHDSAWENPHHRHLFAEGTWAYFDRRIYEIPDNVGSGAHQNHKFAVWSQALMSLTPEADFIKKLEAGEITEEQVSELVKKERNVVKEMQVVLRLEAK
jgi:predicted SAM-dependent methyltransferase